MAGLYGVKVRGNAHGINKRMPPVRVYDNARQAWDLSMRRVWMERTEKMQEVLTMTQPKPPLPAYCTFLDEERVECFTCQENHKKERKIRPCIVGYNTDLNYPRVMCLKCNGTSYRIDLVENSKRCLHTVRKCDWCGHEFDVIIDR